MVKVGTIRNVEASSRFFDPSMQVLLLLGSTLLSQQVLGGAFDNDMASVCPSELASLEDAPRVAIIVSHGVWEASYHNGAGDKTPKAKFRFEENARNTIDYIISKCAGRDMRIVLMTNPAIQLFDGRITDPYSAIHGPRLTAKLYVRGQNNPLRNTRVNVANVAWKKMAADYQLPIVDGESISFPRPEMVMDNVHYTLRYATGEWKHFGNEVTMTPERSCWWLSLTRAKAGLENIMDSSFKCELCIDCLLFFSSCHSYSCMFVHDGTDSRDVPCRKLGGVQFSIRLQ